jgi:DNA-binding CsgD family transcriptional regulator
MGVPRDHSGGRGQRDQPSGAISRPCPSLAATQAPGLKPQVTQLPGGAGAPGAPGAPGTAPIPGAARLPQPFLAVDWELIRRRLHLTAREVEVMRGIWHGRKYGVIARELGISSHTVETHGRHIKAKLGVPSLMVAIHRIYAALFEEELARITEELRAEFVTEHTEKAEEKEGGEGVAK